jgi:hypothetical protein
MSSSKRRNRQRRRKKRFFEDLLAAAFAPAPTALVFLVAAFAATALVPMKAGAEAAPAF